MEKNNAATGVVEVCDPIPFNVQTADVFRPRGTDFTPVPQRCSSPDLCLRILACRRFVPARRRNQFGLDGIGHVMRRHDLHAVLVEYILDIRMQ